jgi:hypothetical protein
MSTDTPRTDDQSVRYYDDATGERIEYVSSRFARQLERERDQWEKAHDNQVKLKQISSDRPDLKERAKLVAELIKERDGWREAAYSLGEAIPASWETLQPPAEQLRKFKEMVALENEKTKKLLDNADKRSKMYPQ